MSAIMPSTYQWCRYYEAAMSETDCTRRSSRIFSAEAAIIAHIREIYWSCADGSVEEKQAIADALRGLRLLRGRVA
jgi:hypothetical protein